MTLNVLVTGAGGRTGGMLFNLLRNDDSFSVSGLVRDVKRASDSLGTSQGLLTGDITKPDTLPSVMEGRDALVILTSAMPLMKPPAEEGAPPTFYFAEGAMPEQVDWIGQRNQIDAAKAAGVKHVVVVGSMGMTDENHPLNRVGNGNILRYKLKAQVYLKESRIPYTIINPSGLTMDPPGKREIILGVKDELFELYGQNQISIARADVARVIVAALKDDSAKNKWFDVASKPLGDGTPTEDPSPLFETVNIAL